VGDKGRREHPVDLEVHVLVEAVEEPLAGAEDDRRGADGQDVDRPGSECLANGVGAAGDRDTLVAGGLARRGQRRLEAVDEDESGRPGRAPPPGDG
jgi:hypothetical protein